MSNFQFYYLAIQKKVYVDKDHVPTIARTKFQIGIQYRHLTKDKKALEEFENVLGY